MVPVPCPACGNVSFSWGPNGEPERRCDGPSSCGFIWGGQVVSKAPASDSRACVLTARGLQMTPDEHVSMDITDSNTVLRTAFSWRRAQIWVSRAAMVRLELPTFVTWDPRKPIYEQFVTHRWTDQLARTGYSFSTPGSGFNPWVGISRHGAWIDVVMAQWNEENPFASFPAIGTSWEDMRLLDALRLYAEHIGIRYRKSPGATGMALLRGLHGGSLPKAADLPDIWPLADQAASSGLYVAPELPRDGYLHGFDINGMYLAACSSAELALGQYRPAHDEAGPVQFFMGRAGYYFCRNDIAELADFLPFQFGEQWLPSPYVQLLAESGGGEIGTSWVPESSGRYLRPWYERIRDARAALRGYESPAADLALDAVKATYTRTLGWFAGGWLKPGDDMFRPDWRAAIVARARANLFRHIRKIHELTGQLPVAQAADLVVYHSPSGEPDQVERELGIETSLQLGKFKYAGWCPAYLIDADRGDRVTQITNLLRASMAGRGKVS